MPPPRESASASVGRDNASMAECCVHQVCRRVSHMKASYYSCPPTTQSSLPPYIKVVSALVAIVVVAVLWIVWKRYSRQEELNPLPIYPEMLDQSGPITASNIIRRATFGSSVVINSSRRRGSSRPTVHVQIPGPILGLDDFVHSPTGTLVDLPGDAFQHPAGSGPIQTADRGRASAVIQRTNSNIRRRTKSGTESDQATMADVSVSLNIQPELGTSGNPAQPTSRQLPSPTLTPRAGTAPGSLFGSLVGFPRVKSPPRTPAKSPRIRILGVGLSWSHSPTRELPGTIHDMNWLAKFFHGQEDIQFNRLLDHDATLAAIHEHFKAMYLEAAKSDHDQDLILYFSGHGTVNNAFELYGSTSEPLNEVMLNQWIVELHEETKRRIPVYIVFDFCRESLVEPSTNLADGVYIIWACSPAQSALDLNLKNKDLPYSCFLLSLLLAIDDVSKDLDLTTNAAPQQLCLALWGRFTVRLAQLVNVVRGIRCLSPGPGKAKCRPPWRCCVCPDCQSGTLCEHEGHPEDRPIQVLGLFCPATPDFSTAAQYVANHFPLHLRVTSRIVTNNTWVLYFNPKLAAINKGSLRSRKLPPSDRYMPIDYNAPRHNSVPIGLSAV